MQVLKMQKKEERAGGKRSIEEIPDARKCMVSGLETAPLCFSSMWFQANVLTDLGRAPPDPGPPGPCSSRWFSMNSVCIPLLLRLDVPPPPDSVSLSCCLLEPSFRSSGVTIFVKHDTEIKLCVGISLVRCFFKPVSSFRRIHFTTFSTEVHVPDC